MDDRKQFSLEDARRILRKPVDPNVQEPTLQQLLQRAQADALLPPERKEQS